MKGGFHGVELGVHRGLMSAGLLKAFPRLVLHMVDPWDTPMRHCPDRMVDMRAACDAVEFAEGRARVYKCTSSEVAALSAIGHCYTLWLAGTGREYVSCSKLSSEFHFVFIDTEHTEESVRRDIDAWWPLVKSGGFLSGHDYGVRSCPGVKKVVDAWASEVRLPLVLGAGKTWKVMKP